MIGYDFLIISSFLKKICKLNKKISIYAFINSSYAR